MAKKQILSDEQLREAAVKYVDRRSAQAGGVKEALRGLQCKTIPVLLGWGKVSWLSVTGLFSRALLLGVAASMPIFVRKVLAGTPAGNSRPSDVLLSTFAKLDAVDLVLAALAVASTFIPKVIDAFAKQKPTGRKHVPFTDLTTAIEQMPEIDIDGRGRDGQSDVAVSLALNSTLRALREEMAELVDDLGRERITEATLLVFDSPRGTQMVVRARTATNEPVGRPVESFRLLAYYVALLGRPFVEHDFLHPSNPFPAKRLTVPGSQRVDYRSVLYLPVMGSEVVEIPMPAGVQGTPIRQVVDNVMGVICVHCAKPYRFWRFGDHRKPHDGFGTIAYARALPYIALVTRLIEGRAPKVTLESK